MMPNRDPDTVSTLSAVLRMLFTPSLHGPLCRWFKAVFSKFFALQYRAARNPGLIPVSAVDHALDEAIPFSPQWVGIYLDFVPFWMRTVGFLLKACGAEARPGAAYFIESMGRIYDAAAEVYARRLSTTRRPRYLGSPRFMVIHAFDPHLMCIPSLHVMVVVRTYTAFRAVLRGLGREARFSAELEAAMRRAVAITESLLYIKQHSVNCVAAALYAMTRFDPPLFPEAEARRFVEALFAEPGLDGRPAETLPAAPERAAVREHIWHLYRCFIQAGTSAPTWEAPLIAFLSEQPPPA
jgi:hypothetical protein